MPEKIKKSYVNLTSDRVYNKAVNILFPVLIVLYAFMKVNKGGDITDTAYSYSNFVNVASLDGMWFYSTFYANLLGFLFTRLPFGHTMLFLNIYTGLIKASLGLIAYFFSVKVLKSDKILSLIAGLVSLGLCWCPTATLYNYLTYLFFSLGAIFLYRGLTEERNGLLVLAGFFLGSNLFVRFPNVMECALILPLVIYGILKKESARSILNKSLFSIAGYLLAFIPAAILILVTRGFSEYINGIIELFSMSDVATGYSPVGMLMLIIRGYIEALRIFIPLLVIFAVLFVLDLFKKIPLPVKYAFVCISVLSILYYWKKKNVFNFNFHTLEPVYHLASVFTVIMVIVFITAIFGKATPEEKLLALISGVIIAITPIGSNNGLYPIFNNMFFVLPVFLLFLSKGTGTVRDLTALRAGIALFSLAFFFQSFMVGAIYIFRDGITEKMNVSVDNRVFKGMKTTESNAKRLTAVTSIWEEYDLFGEEALFYGDCPGLSFYLESPPAISTAWPSLDSFSEIKFKTEINELGDSIDDGKLPPPVVTGTDLRDGGKKEILNDFLDKYDYKEIYTDSVFNIYLPKERINE